MTVEEAKNRLLIFTGDPMLAQAVEDLIRAMLEAPRCDHFWVDGNQRIPCERLEGHKDAHKARGRSW